MDFTIPMPPLKNMAITSIARSLCLSSLIICKSKSGFDLKESNHIISEKVDSLNLDDAIKKYILRLVKPIVFQIYKWLIEHLKAGTLDFEVTRKTVDFLTTEFGSLIDNIGLDFLTTETMLRDMSLENMFEFELFDIEIDDDDIGSGFLTTETMSQDISLENMSIIRVTRLLWSSKALLKEFVKFSQTLDETHWNNIASNVIANAKLLPLTTRVKEILVNLLPLVNSEIHNWVMTNREKSCFDFEVTYPSLNHLRWTSVDTIAARKTAQTLVKLPTELSKRYKLACLYSLEDIESLWNQLQPQDFYEKNLATIEIEESFITFFWSCQEGNDLARLNEVVETRFPGRTVHERLIFVVAEEVKCLTVFRLYWDVLTREKQNNLLVVAQTASENKSPEILIFLLQEMTPQVMETFLINNTYNILLTFLQWPYQNLFLKLFKLKSEILSPAQYFEIFKSVITSLEYNYSDILISLWTNSSESHRRFVLLHDDSLLQLLRQMFEMDYVEVLKLIWNGVDRNERDLKFVRISHILIRKSDWYFLNYLLPLCLTGDFAVVKYKRYMNDYAKRIMPPTSADFENWNNADRLTLFEHLYDIFKE